jgi:integrase
MSRRGPNEGNIYLRADGRWVARLHLGYERGRRRRKHLYAHTRREALDKLDRARHDRKLGLGFSGNERQTVAQFLDRWLIDAARPSVRPRTYATYESYVRVHLIPAIGSVPLQKLGPADVQRLLNAKLDAGLAPRTVLHIRAVLRHALNQAVRWGILLRNAASLVDCPRVPAYEVRAMSPEEARLLLKAVHGDRLESAYVLALGVGLRQGELLGLEWDDVDLDAATLQVRQTLQRIEGKLRIVEPKTRRSRRVVLLPRFVIAALRAHRARQLEERHWAGSRWHENRFVFTSTIGTPLDGTNVTHRLHVLLDRAGIPRIRFHDLRHACATLLVGQGVHMRVVMETLGHSQIGLTMNTYAHVLPSLQQDAADRMEAALSTHDTSDIGHTGGAT